MANSVTSSDVVQTEPNSVQKIVAAFDTAGTVLSQAMTFDHEPDEYWAVLTSGNDADEIAAIELAFDTANGEVDLLVEVISGGTVAHTYTVFLKWYAQAEQDQSSVTIS